MFEEPKLNLLIAYPYCTPDAIQVIEKNKKCIRFLLDSGAFTAWKAGKPISVDEYSLFLETLPFEPWRYFTLDVIGNPEGTLKNYDALQARGFKPVPIFTRGENLEILDRYYETSEVVGIGGLVGTRGNKGFVKGIMKAVNERRVHWLGFTSLPFLKVYRPYMADSSSWEMGARYGQTPLYLGGGAMTQLRKISVLKHGLLEQEKQAVLRLGFDPERLRVESQWHGGRSISRMLGAASMVKLSLEVERRLGTKLFLAAATAYATELLLEQFNRIRSHYESHRHSLGGNGLSNSPSLGQVPA